MAKNGIESLRQQLKQAVAVQEKLRGTVDNSIIDATIATLKEKLTALDPAPRQQRKLATILFMDIAGHTALTFNLDPEEQMAVVDPIIARLAGKVSERGGHVARFTGDGFKAVFGLPVAEENDARQAVRAGLAILAEAETIASSLEEEGLSGFKVRVGISTGQIFSGGQTEREDTIKGMTVNLAARLESAAPGGLLISHFTYQHIRGFFDVEPLEAVHAKGFPDPVKVYLVKREKLRAFHMKTRGVEGLETRTVGRDVELRILQKAAHSAYNQNQTTVITIVGEAGIGKSRLIYEFNNWLELQPEPIWYFKGRASQQTQGNPQYLLRNILAWRFQILDSDPLAVVREKLVRGVGEFLTEDLEMKAHILGDWLGYDFSTSPHLAQIRDEREQIKNRATLYLAQLFRAITEQDPAILFVEDIHWADSSSLDALIDLARWQSDLPLLLVYTARPSLFERRSDWGARLPFHTRLDLSPLTDEDTIALVAEILRRVEDLPRSLFDIISSRAEGNPFYAEELVKMLIDEGTILTGPETWEFKSSRLETIKVPPTLTGVLQARLEKLQPEEKQVAQQAAVVGRVFWNKALAVMQDDGPKVLPTLQAKELIFLRGESSFEGMNEYIFKHAILRDVVYETVLKSIRRRYHTLVAGWLTDTAKQNTRIDEYAPQIGEHYQFAGDYEQALVWYGRAGKQAADLYAHKEAIRYLTLALEFVPEDAIDDRMDLLTCLERVHSRQGNREAQQIDLEQMEELAKTLGPEKQALVALRWAGYANHTNNYPEAIHYCKLAIKRDNSNKIATEAYRKWGYALIIQGKYQQALEILQQGLSLAKEGFQRSEIAKCLNNLGLVSLETGDFAAASDYFEQALLVYIELGDRFGESMCQENLGVVAVQEGNYLNAMQFYLKSLSINQECGFRFLECSVLINLGFIAWSQGDMIKATDYYQQALTISQKRLDQRHEGVTLINLGHLATFRGDIISAEKYYKNALKIFRQIGVRWGTGICLNELGFLALSAGKKQLAETNFLDALSMREELNLVHFLVEDWVGLAKLYFKQGNRKTSHQYCQKILQYLKDNPRFEGAENRMRAFRYIWETLVALDENDAANEVLLRATEVMQDYLDKNSDPKYQQMYLSQPHHKVLWTAWERKKRDGSKKSKR